MNFFMLAMIMFLCMSWIWLTNSAKNQIGYYEVQQLIRQERVESVKVQDN